MIRDLLIVLALPLFAAPALADVITVGPFGSGAQFNQIEQAVTFASPGDTVLVAPGDYEVYPGIHIDKPLTLLGSGSGLTRVTCTSTFPGDLPIALLITEIGPGEHTYVSGLDFRSITFTDLLHPAIWVSGNPGSVAFSDVTATARTSGTKPRGVVGVNKSRQVSFDNCEFIALSALYTFNITLEAAGLWIKDSTVLVNNCTLVGADGQTSSDYSAPGGPGILSDQSDIYIANSELRGGTGATHATNSPTAGGPGLWLLSSTAVVTGGAANAMVGADGGVGVVAGLPATGAGASAIELDALSTMTTATDVSMVAGIDGDGLSTSPLVSPQGSWTALTERMASISITDNLATSGSTVTLNFEGEPLVPFSPYYSLSQGPTLTPPGFLGAIILSLPVATAMPPIMLDAAGQGMMIIPVPSAPSLVGIVATFQGFTLSPLALLSIAPPTTTAIRF